jgi:hypothetical protein
VLGWDISVYRLAEPNPLLGIPDVVGLTATFSTESDLEALVAGLKKGKCIAVWETSLGGVDWIDDLVERQQALLLARNQGYPYVYVGRAEYLIPPVVGGPPVARPRRTVIDRAEGRAK